MDSEYDDLLATMNSLKGDVRKRALSKSLRAMGEVVEKAIIQRAPFQSGEATHGLLAPGELAANITTRVHIATDENAASDSDYVSIGPNRKVDFVAKMVETGHATRARNKPKNTPRVERVEAHPFVRPAYDATKDEAIAVFEETMAEQIAAAMEGTEVGE